MMTSDAALARGCTLVIRGEAAKAASGVVAGTNRTGPPRHRQPRGNGIPAIFQ